MKMFNPSHMCQFLSGSDATHIAPYVSNSIEERRGGYSIICVKFILTHMRLCFNALAAIEKPLPNKRCFLDFPLFNIS
ncbi:MAG TPA: hypothetical protein PLI57_04245 [Spirochaetota bacterium]|nr:hypothetical protein [Spirochaetota bacterium]